MFRHLKLCSRLKNPSERASYVEMHRCSILKNSLPPETLNTITKKEQIYRAFSSQEILDHVISGYHLAGAGDETEQYHVFYTAKSTEDLSPAASQIRTLEQKNEQRRKPVDSNTPGGKTDQGKYNTRGKTRGRGGQNSFRGMGNRTGANFRPDNQRNFQGNGSLPRLQDVPRGTCVKCLSNQHVTQACRVYSRAQICQSVCVVNGRPNGFHSSLDCAVKQNWNRQGENRRPGFNSFQNRNQNSRSGGYQNRDQHSRVFRPFRIQK